MKNLSSYCGLVDARISASDKDLPVIRKFERLKFRLFFVENLTDSDFFHLF